MTPREGDFVKVDSHNVTGMVRGVNRHDFETTVEVITPQGPVSVTARACRKAVLAFAGDKKPCKKKREVAPQWVAKLAKELTDDEKAVTLAALGGLMLDNYSGTVDHLWERYERGVVGCMVLLTTTGEIASTTFYEIVELHDGSLCFESLCTVAVGPTARCLTDDDMEKMEALARSITNPDGRQITSMAMATPRHGLVKQLTSKKHGWFVSYMTVRKILLPLP